jgi:hypothetical protein
MPLNAAKVKSRIFFSHLPKERRTNRGRDRLGTHFCLDRRANHNRQKANSLASSVAMPQAQASSFAARIRHNRA